MNILISFIMKKNYILLLITIIITILILLNSNIVIKSVIYSFSIWEKNIFPSLFPFLVLGSVLIELNLPQILGKYLNDIMYKVFKINGNSSFILILSMISGTPSSAKYTVDMLNKGLINEYEATKILTFTHFSNPLFILGTIPVLLNDKKIGIPILVCHYLGNIIVGLLWRDYYISNKEYINFNIDKKIKPFGNILSKSIISAINTLLYVLGTISIFLIITSITNNYLNLPPYINSIFNGVFEMTQGLKSLELLNISLNQKAMLAITFLSFGGLSVHMQILGIISDTKIKYFPYFISRILHASISTLIFFIWKVL